MRASECYEAELRRVKVKRDKLVDIAKRALSYLPEPVKLKTKIAHLQITEALRNAIDEIEAEETDQ
jgi:hypothetical protein